MERIMKILNEIGMDVDFEKSNDFIEEGLLDSLDIMVLVEKLEDEFDVEVMGSDIIPENFSNVDKMKRLVIKLGGNI